MMRESRPLRAALVGIDGCGKTTVADRLRGPGTVVIHTIHPHETVDGPFHELSRHLQTLSVTADRLRSPQLKVAAFYLLLHLYAPTERFLTQTFAPHTILSDRHPLIDAMVYLPLYRRAATSAAPPPNWAGELEPDTHTGPFWPGRDMPAAARTCGRSGRSCSHCTSPAAAGC